MRDYNELFDWLEKFRLTIYIDNFVKGGFDMTSVLGITAEVRKLKKKSAFVAPSWVSASHLNTFTMFAFVFDNHKIMFAFIETILYQGCVRVKIVVLNP